MVVNGLYQPVEEDTMVGGDMYEVAASRHGTRVLIADVQGKGLPAIGTALAVLGSFREAAYREPTLTGVVAALETSVVRQKRVRLAHRRARAAGHRLVLDIGEGPVVEAVNCGHIAPFVIHDGDAAQADLGEPAVRSALAALSPAPRKGTRFTFPPGRDDAAVHRRGHRGPRPPRRLLPAGGAAARLRPRPSGGLAARLEADLRGFTRAAPRDDIAILTLRRTEPSP
ncbi:hypothetical protein GCM10020220_111660 [Nonomuraea rubra]